MFQIQAINHVNMVVDDIRRAVYFYSDILGMENIVRNPQFTLTGAWLRANNAEIHLIQADVATHAPGDLSFRVLETTDKEISSSRHFSLVIDDTQALVSQLQKHQVRIVLGPVERPNGLVQTYCYDPDGHLIEFTELRK